MPAPDRAFLLDAAQALQVALDPSQTDRLLQYVALLAKWNRVVNLTAIDEPGVMLTHHVLDSLAVVAPLRRQGVPSRLLDVGSGGGLPGLVIAIAMPEVQVTCVDSIGKKVAFLRDAASELGLTSITACHAQVQGMEGAFDLVTSRAFASLAKFVEVSRERLSGGGVWMAMKGRVPSEEIADLPGNIDMFHVEQLKIPGLNAERCLVWLRPLTI